MTKINPLRPVVRELDVMYRHVPLVKASHPKYVALRPKGSSESGPDSVTVPWDAIYELGMKMKARQGRQVPSGR